jgi:hypothetical protein
MSVCSCGPATTLDSRHVSITRLVQQSHLAALIARPARLNKISSDSAVNWVPHKFQRLATY